MTITLNQKTLLDQIKASNNVAPIWKKSKLPEKTKGTLDHEPIFSARLSNCLSLTLFLNLQLVDLLVEILDDLV